MNQPKIHATKINGRLYIRADSVVGVLKFIKSYWSEKEAREAVKKIQGGMSAGKTYAIICLLIGYTKLLNEGAVNEKNAKDVADTVCHNFRSAISIAIEEFKAIEAQAYEEEEEK